MSTNSKNKNIINDSIELIKKAYLSDNRPWVIGYSGGKDSSCIVQLVWNALLSIEKSKLTKPVYIITSDTLVETPAIEAHLLSSIEQIGNAAKKQELPFQAHTVIPKIEETFWVKLIGNGYPAPYTNFRWCTDRLKIKPTTQFIKDRVAEYGEVVILLGARKAESSSRAQVMSKRKGIDVAMSRHNDLSNAYVFTPIEDWTADDVWTYLLNSKSPWGFNNRELVTMYRNAQSGECPLVIDKSTPSCGGGRFGCWTCTVVQRDRSMENMIDNGEDWMIPLLEFRDFLTSTQNPETKEKYREYRRKSGRIEFFERDGKKGIIWGPYKMEARKDFLKRLLKAQNDVREHGPNPTVELIRKEELHKIRQIWIHEENQWDDPLPKIYEEITGEKLEWTENDFSGMGGLEKNLIAEIAQDENLPEGLLLELFELEQKYDGMSRRSGIYQNIDKTLKKDWRTKKEVFEELEKQNEEGS